jgi:glutaredoxin
MRPTAARWLAACLLLGQAYRAQASPAVLGEARAMLAKGKLVDVLTLLRPDEGKVARGEERRAAALLSEATQRAREKQPELALQLAEASFALDPRQAPVLDLLGSWALEDEQYAQARRYAEFWVAVAPDDPRARNLQEKAAAGPSLLGRVGRRVSAFLGHSHPRAATGKPKVLYGTAWCPYCKAARAWCKAKGQPVIEKDIEQDPAARDELERRGRELGVHTRGVPVLDTGDELVQGFNPDTYAKQFGIGE